MYTVAMRFSKAATNTNPRRALTNHEWEKYCFVAMGSLYGVELLHDNCVACREWLYKIVEGEYKHVARKQQNPAFLDAVWYVLERNVLNGNALSLKAVDENGNDTDEPIIFSEWSIVTGDRVKRRDFRLDEMLEGGSGQQQVSLFGLSDTPSSEWELDEETGSLIPKPIREFPLVSFYEVAKVD